MEGLVHYLDMSLAGGSVVSLLIMFGAGFALSFNPRMGAIAPLVIGGNRQSGYSRSFLFMGGYTLTLMFLGLLAASLGNVLTLPGWFWTFFLGILYLIVGLFMLQVKLPITVSGLYVPKNKPHWLWILANKHGLNPAVLGVVFALVPGPMIMAISGFVLASGQMIFGCLALGFFGLGHSLPLALAFVPWCAACFVRTVSLTFFVQCSACSWSLWPSIFCWLGQISLTIVL